MNDINFYKLKHLIMEQYINRIVLLTYFLSGGMKKPSWSLQKGANQSNSRPGRGNLDGDIGDKMFLRLAQHLLSPLLLYFSRYGLLIKF